MAALILHRICNSTLEVTSFLWSHSYKLSSFFPDNLRNTTRDILCALLVVLKFHQVLKILLTSPPWINSKGVTKSIPYVFGSITITVNMLQEFTYNWSCTTHFRVKKIIKTVKRIKFCSNGRVKKHEDSQKNFNLITFTSMAIQQKQFSLTLTLTQVKSQLSEDESSMTMSLHLSSSQAIQ